MKYRIELSITSENGTIATSIREANYDKQKIDNYGWRLGQDIADAIIGVECYLTHKDFSELFEAINDRLQDYQATFKENT